MSVRVPTHLDKTIPYFFTCLLCLCYSSQVFSGYKAYLDPRSMAMGGTGVAASTKFNASSHNPALIAFNRGDKPDKIYVSASMGTREIYNESLNDDILDYQDSGIEEDFIDAVRQGASNVDEARVEADRFRKILRKHNYSSYRSDEMDAFSLLVDTEPVTINVFTRREIREITVFLNQDEELITLALEQLENGEGVGDISSGLTSSVDSTHFDFMEFGATVATTNVIDYNMPISWGFTPKLIQFNASHISKRINEYNVNDPEDARPGDSNLEWNLDVGFAMLFTDDFLREEFGLDGWWLEGEWVFAFSGMNMLPTDISNYSPARFNPDFPGDKASVQALYQVGLAHYREKYMLTLDIELTEDKVYEGFEGNRRFVSFGGEYYWRDDFHLRGGLRVNVSQTERGAKESTSLHGGFMYQPHGLSIEAAAMVSEYEVGGTVGFGLAF
ncbi:MAG: conjugal transfer protein TraF [Oleiphilus sp.]